MNLAENRVFRSVFNAVYMLLVLKCHNSIKEISPGGANSKHFVQSTPYVRMARMHKLYLMTPQGHLVHLAMVYGQFLHLHGITKFLNKFPIFLP